MLGALLFLTLLIAGTFWLIKRDKIPGQEIKILIANLDGPEEYKVTQAVIAQMRESVEKKIQKVRVVPLGRKITEQEGPAKAIEEGRKIGANLVLWGYYNIYYRGKVHIEQLKTPRRLHLLKESYDFNPPAAERRGLTVEEDLSGEVNHLVLVLTGLTRFEVGDYAAAIECYNQAIAQRSAPEQLVDQLDIYRNRGEARLYLGGAEQISIDHSDIKTGASGGFYLGRGGPTERQELNEAIADFTQVITVKQDDVHVLFLRATAQAIKHAYQEALNDFDLILKLSPDQADAYCGRGIVNNLLKKYDQAIADYNVAETLSHHNDAHVYYNRAITFATREEFRLALQDYNRALALDQADIDSIINRALVYAELGEHRFAISELNRSLQNEPPSTIGYSRRGDAWAEIGMMDKALIDFNAAVSLSPTSPIGYHNRGHLFHKWGQLDKAIADFSQVISLDPKADYAYHDRGLCWAIKGNADEAIKDCTEAINLNPNWAVNWFNRGSAYHGLKQYPLAIDNLTKAIGIEFDDKYMAYFVRGLVKFDMGDYWGAIKDYSDAITANPGFVDILLKKATTWMKVKKPDSSMRDYQVGLSIEIAISEGNGIESRREIYQTAITDLTDALKYNPRNEDGYIARSLAYVLSNNYEQALQDINAAIELHPGSYDTKFVKGDARLYKGNILFNLKRYEEAVESYSESIKLNSQVAQTWYLRGNAYIEQNQLSLALEDFSQSLNIDPAYLKARIERGRCYATKKDFQQAIADFDAVLETKPNQDQALLYRGLANADLGNRQQAISDLTRAYFLGGATDVRHAAHAELARLGASDVTILPSK